jgi:outer membrane usher protein
VKPSRSRFRWTQLLISILLSAIAMGAAAANTTMLAMNGDTLAAASSEMDLYLEVVLNQQPTSKLAHFIQRNGKLWASTATLQDLGFVLPAGTPDPVQIDNLPGVVVDYDAARQKVSITAPLKLLDYKTAVLNAPKNTVPRATTSPGMLLNYDIYGTQDEHGASGLNAYTELRAFGSAGVLSNTMLTQGYRASDSDDWHGQSVRLDTSYRHSWPDSMLSLTVGDTLTSSLSWTRATRIAGIQLSRNYALQPYLVTTPVPAFFGQATVPSEVDLYINGIKQYSGNVAPGPFQLNTAPIISGNGNAQVVLTDAFGRTTTLAFPFYTTAQLLKKGLLDGSAEIGVVRKNYGLSSFDYGHDPVASGTVRYGVSDNFTVESHAEAGAGVVDAGVGGAWLAGRAGVLSGSASRSGGSGSSGSQFGLGYDWRSGPFNVSLNSLRTYGDYHDVASAYGTPPPSITERALVGVSTARAGSFSLSYLRLRYPGQDPSRYASAYWSRSFGRSVSVNFSVNQNLNDHSDRSLFFGISIYMNGNFTLSSSAQRDGDSTTFTLGASHPVSDRNSFGWRVQAQHGDGQSGGLAEGSYRTQYNDFTAGINSWGDNSYAYADAAGALVLMGGHMFAARRIDNAFAVVSTDGVANVPIKLENRVIGHTDSDGMLLVTPLNAWQRNQIAIDPMQLPADMRIDHVKTIATPSDRAGTLVNFGITPVRAASIVLINASGKTVPIGSRVHIAGQPGSNAIVGFDGAVYLDTLQTHNTLDVETPTGTCHVSFDYHKQGGSIPEIGPLTCQMETH